MAKIILCRGIQGSGKTTWAKQWVLVGEEVIKATYEKYKSILEGGEK